MAETVRDTAGSGIADTATIQQAEQVTTLHIRFIVHYAMPGSLDTYYQESGRAGPTVNNTEPSCRT